MKKILPLIIIGILFLSGIGAAGLNNNLNKTDIIKTISFEENVVFKSPTLKNDGEFIQLSIKNNENYHMIPGEPMLPRVLNKYELPFGAKNIKINLETKSIKEIEISGEIIPSPIYLPLSPIEDFIAPPEKVEKIYNSNDLYPESWYSYNIGCGLNNDFEHVTHVTLNIYPYRYQPKSQKIIAIDDAEVKISYEKPNNNPFPQTSDYDMVIIAPSSFENALQRLIDHKNNLNPPVTTTLKTTEEIYSDYTGRDKPEQIKYFIKDAIETLGVKYVLLVGGLKNKIWAEPMETENYGAKDWYIPVRWSHVEPSSEPGPVSDLYYADIYKEEGEFDDWDADGDGIFAEYKNFGGDKLDLYPDVGLGRLS